jgi:hypothetical protein
MMRLVNDFKVPMNRFSGAVNGIGQTRTRPRDAVWQVWQELLSQKQSEMYHDSIYRDMAMFVLEEGRDWRPYLELAVQTNLKRALQAPFVGVEIENGVQARTCTACTADNGKKYSRETALKKKPLPHSNCQCLLHSGAIGICQCTYASLIDL